MLWRREAWRAPATALYDDLSSAQRVLTLGLSGLRAVADREDWTIVERD
jgi:hypothetical protein